MRYVLFTIFLFISGGVLAACGSNDYAGDTNKADAETEEVAKEEEETGDPVLEIVESTGGAWKDSIDTVWVHSSAIFENTGEVAVEIAETQMNFKGDDDSVLGTASMIYSVPRIVEPGEQAYITESTILDGTENAEAYEETTYNFGFDATKESPNLLETSSVKGVKGDKFNPYIVTGTVENTTDEKQDNIRIAAALFSEDGTLLGVLQTSVDVGINSGSEAGFELNYPEIPSDVADEIDNVEVKAYGFTW